MRILLLTAMIALTSLAQQAPRTEKRFDVVAPQTTDTVSMAISPDGRKLVFTGASAPLTL